MTPDSTVHALQRIRAWYAPMYVGQNWGLPVTPSFTGGNDYAQGGAAINSPQPPGDVPAGLPNLSVTLR